MRTVVFVPELRGQDSLKSTFDPLAVSHNEARVMHAASSYGWAFKKFNYQFPTNPNALFSNMELAVLAELEPLLFKTKAKEPLLIVGDSFGFGVLVGALSRLGDCFTSSIALLGIKPVIDPLQAVELQINKPQIVDDIKNGRIPKARLLFENAKGLQSTFMLSTELLNDVLATRILTQPDHRIRFQKASTNLHSATLIYGDTDRLTPSSNMEQFSNAVTGAKTELIALRGNHLDDFSLELHHQTRQMIARLG